MSLPASVRACRFEVHSPEGSRMAGVFATAYSYDALRLARTLKHEKDRGNDVELITVTFAVAHKATP
jgi:hypothetical protein